MYELYFDVTHVELPFHSSEIAYVETWCRLRKVLALLLQADRLPRRNSAFPVHRFPICAARTLVDSEQRCVARKISPELHQVD